MRNRISLRYIVADASFWSAPRRCLLLLACVTFGSGIGDPAGGLMAAPMARTTPHPLWWHDSSGAARTQVGVVYFPQVLASILAEATENPASLMVQAVRQRTPVVVMWNFPEGEGAPWPRPFGMAIVERGGDYASHRIESLWIHQDPGVFKGLDPRAEFRDIGAVAAFESSAFVRGRLVVLYSGERRPGVRAQRWGTIDWDGTGE